MPPYRAGGELMSGALQPPFYDYPPTSRIILSGQQLPRRPGPNTTRSVSDQLAALASLVQSNQEASGRDGSDATAGQIGEYLTAHPSSGAVTPSTGAVSNMPALPADGGATGDVAGNVITSPTAGVTYAACSVSTTSAAHRLPLATRIPAAGTATRLRIGTGGGLRVSVPAPTTGVSDGAGTAFSSSSMSRYWCGLGTEDK